MNWFLFWILFIGIFIMNMAMSSRYKRRDITYIIINIIGIGLIVFMSLSILDGINPNFVSIVNPIETTTTIQPTPIITTTTSTTLNMEDVWNKRLTEYYEESTS